MKTNLLKKYIAAIYFCSNFATYAQLPGTEDNNGGLEGADTPAAPIDGYVWVLAAMGLVYVFWRIRVFTLEENLPKEKK